jgi:transposase InsO family protein
MGMPELIVTAVLTEGRAKSEVARDYGVSRRWVITLCQRYQTEGPTGLQPRSRRPHTSPTQTAREVEEEIVRIRKDLDKHGHEAGADTIRSHLLRRQGQAPATSTIWRILTDRGFVTPQPHKRPKSSYLRFQAEQPNELWQTDLTHWALADGTDVEIGNWLDDHSRLCLDSRAKLVFKGPDVDRHYQQIADTHGDPAAVLSDNGAVYTGAYRRQGRVTLEITLTQRGVQFKHSRPYHPQTCGKVERFHQTLKKHLATLPRARTLADLQRQLDAFKTYYNHQRPHRALGRRTPAEAYQARPKATSLGRPLIDPHGRVRHDIVDSNGKLTLRYNSRLHHIGLGRRYAGTRVLMMIKDQQVRIVNDSTKEVLRDFILDPSRDYQPQPKT